MRIRLVGSPLLALGIFCVGSFFCVQAWAQQSPETDPNASQQQTTGTQTTPSGAPVEPQTTQQPAAQSAPAGQDGAGAATGDGASSPAPNVAPGITPAPDNSAPAGTTLAAGHVVPAGKIELPTGTHLLLVLHNGVSTRTARVGDPVYFETLFPIMQDGKIIIPAGSYVSGEITESKRPGRVKGRGELMLRLETLILPNAYMVRFDGTPSGASTGGNETTTSEGKIEGDSSKKGDVGTVAKTTAAGAGIGGIAARSATGAGIGAGIGAAAGLAAVLLTRGPEAEMPRGTTLEAILDRPLDFDAARIDFTSPGQASTLAGPANRQPGRVTPF